MPLCQAFKGDYTPCTRNATRNGGEDTHPEHLHLCGTHKTTYRRNFFTPTNAHHTPGRCFELHRVHGVLQWCPFDVPAGQILCQMHELKRQENIERREQRDNNQAIIAGLVEALLAEDPPVPCRRAVRILADMADVTVTNRFHAAFNYWQHPRTRELEPDAPEWLFQHYWEWTRNGQAGPEPHVVVLPPVAPRPAGLARLAQDAQNVHTRVVTEQTNKATEKLLAVKVPESQQTEKTLALVWLNEVGGKISYVQFLRVSADINRWFNTKDCRVAGDYLYRLLLRGLVGLISSEKDDERRSEMYRRCWEECNEAVGMCCEGHISRLCNVLVGFDEAFQSPVPFGEILQQKMAAISAMDLSEEEKRKLANAFFDEHKTPAEERSAWLDGF